VGIVLGRHVAETIPNLLHRQHFRLHKLQEAVRHASTSKPPAPSASSSLHKLREAVRHVATRKRKTPGQIKAWLETQDAYTMHRPVRKRFPRNAYTVNNIDDVWEIDIMDLSSVKKYNDNHRYLLQVIEVFSKYLHSIPLRTKTERSHIGTRIYITGPEIYQTYT